MPETVRIPRHTDAGSWPAGPGVFYHTRLYRLEWRPRITGVSWVAMSMHKYFPLTQEQYSRADRDNTRRDGDTLVLALKEAPKGSPPPKITDFSLSDFTTKIGQTKLKIRWTVPKDAQPPVERIALERNDPEFGKSVIELGSGDGYKIHECGPHGRYAFRVQAQNAEGPGEWSDEIEYIHPKPAEPKPKPPARASESRPEGVAPDYVCYESPFASDTAAQERQRVGNAAIEAAGMTVQVIPHGEVSDLGGPPEPTARLPRWYRSPERPGRAWGGLRWLKADIL